MPYKKDKRCVDCGTLIRRNNIRCGECFNSEANRKNIGLSKMGEKNPQWKGTNVGYLSLHEWIRNRKPKPEVCANCKINKPYDLANISGEYKRDTDDFKWLCRGCHMKEDGRLNILLKKGKNSRRRKVKGKLFKCGECGEFKNKDNFYNSSRTYDELSYNCKKCTVDRQRRYYKQKKNGKNKKSI